MSGLAAALADRYAIEGELGRGGMATVYRAHDRKHQRLVAIKVLRADMAASIGAQRFLREIHTAARLQHPNILTLFDSGAADGFLYYVMPYVDGESLRRRLDREHQLSLDDALRITRELAGALSHAHARDVVHRDIKPENILFAGNAATDEVPAQALLADFGIARTTLTSGETLTQTGMSIGTPSYMSPEQASGERDVDGRADTYALGCVLYEMLAGHPPFLGTTAQEIVARHIRDPVPPLRTTRADLPEFVERAVMKALAKSPADRFVSASALAAALSPPAAAAAPRSWIRRSGPFAAGVVVLAAGYALVHSVRASDNDGLPGAAGVVPSIAVLPCTNVGGDSANEPFSDGVADELTTALIKVNDLKVVPRTSTFGFRRSGLDVREIGRRLGVRYIVECRVQVVEARRRVGADLIDVAGGRAIWSDNFEPDARNRDVFSIQESLTRSIVQQLLPRISKDAIAPSLRQPTRSPEAHDLYMQGRYFFEKRDSASLSKAQAYFQRAITADTLYALAYAGLSDAYSHQSVFGFALPAENFRKARESALRALALDSTLVEGHSSLGFIALFYDWDFPVAGREFQRAVALNPRYAPTYLYRAWYFLATDSVAEAIASGRHAAALDPFSSVINTRLVSFFFFGHQFDEALDQAKATFERDSNFIGVRTERARVYVHMGRCTEALAELEHPGVDQPAAQLAGLRGYINAKCGRRPAALAELDHLRSQAGEGKYVTHYGLAIIGAGLGNTELALTELERACAERAWAMFLLRREPAFDALRSDRRFIALLQNVSLGSRASVACTR